MEASSENIQAVPSKRSKTNTSSKTSVGRTSDSIQSTSKSTSGTSSNDSVSDLVPKTDIPLWNARKFSKSSYLMKYFTLLAQRDENKMDVLCKLCGSNSKILSITAGNNSNLLKHIQTVLLLLYAEANLPELIDLFVYHLLDTSIGIPRNGCQAR